MRVVLGIDAAWTPTQPSGVAVVAENSSGWRLIAAEASYENFIACAGTEPSPKTRPRGSIPEVPRLLDSAKSISGGTVNLVAIDMPISHEPIVGRRVSDNVVSKVYGSRNCSTHTPSAQRPGKISDDLKLHFEHVAYPLLTSEIASQGIIEVYPHPALVELAAAPNRLPYKASKTKIYWPEKDLTERKELLHAQWRRIVELLSNHIDGVAELMPVPSLGIGASERKAFEDKLDAVISAWVGVCALQGKAKPFGDHTSAIWIPALKA